MKKRRKKEDVKAAMSAQRIREYFNTPHWNKVKKKNYGFI
jgi:hypothetical protein